MKRTAEANKTLLVDGPASVTLLSGEAQILGARLKLNSKMVIRESKRVPFYVTAKAEFEVMLGDKGATNDVADSTIPKSWEAAVQTVLTDKNKPLIAMIVGAIDVGKTSFCAYLTNMALREKWRVTIVDADLGQADVGPPSTIGSCRITKPIRDPFDIGAEDICFIGVTSPSSAVNEVVDGIGRMTEKALKRGVDLLIVNTDGWVEGEDAVRYKLALAKRIRPSILIGLQEQNELTFLLGALTEIKTIAVESSPSIRKRDREERKLLRELGYKKYLKGAAIQSFPLNWIKVSGAPFGSGVSPSRKLIEEIVKQIGTAPLYCEETPDSIFIALTKEQWADEEIAKTLEDTVKKKVRIAWEGDEEGLLVALHDKDGSFLGIGVIEELDYERRVLKVYTNVKKNTASIQVGQIKLDKSGKELEQSSIFGGDI
ncbi:MAG TPA: Clp1/GlmU family protein [Candidatus Bathyarchaeia archaeon]|nr:Clp1/GlmU family protein [Candidatus Bathyarchaeia archaeon]